MHVDSVAISETAAKFRFLPWCRRYARAAEGYSGPAIQMERADHKLTASYGRTGAAKAHQQRQKKLISEGRFDDAIQMDIDDVTSKFPGKYDEAILQMIDTLPWPFASAY